MSGRVVSGRAVKRLATVLAVLCLTALASCSDDTASASGTDPVEVEVGKAFEWNGFSVEDGWKVVGIDRAVDMEQVTTPEVSGTIVNTSDEERAAIFQMVFSTDGEPVATVSCSAAKMIQDQSMRFICPGLSATMPADYDAVVVQEFTRENRSGQDTSSSS